MKRSYIREILDAATQETVSFAGGLPDETLFDLSRFNAAAAIALKNRKSLQYGQSAGYMPLREKIAQRYSKHGFATSAEEIIITSGSQQALNLIAMRFLKSPLTIEAPSYLGALGVFTLHGIACDAVKLENDGIALEAFEQRCAQNKAAYLITDFHNPTGIRYSQHKRKSVAGILMRNNALLIEDGAYRELGFEETATPISALMPESSFHIGSFSKSLAPGLRTGWIRCSKEKITQLLPVKEALDLHTSSFNQHLIDAYWERYGIDENIARIRGAYETKMHALAMALKTHLREFTFTPPSGGMFIYGRLKGVDTALLARRCMAYNVAIVPGAEFYRRETPCEEIRLNFTHPTLTEIDEGVRRMAHALQTLQS